MRRLTVLGAFLVLTSNLSIVAFAVDDGWKIDSFSSSLFLNNNTTVDVTEKIDVDFDVEKHGIIRNIPDEYYDKNGNMFSIRLKVKSVTDEVGTPWEYDVLSEYPYKRIKIGSADILLTGKHSYVIVYHVEKTYLEHADMLEYFWNATGTFPVEIGKAQMKVSSPGIISDTRCFVGYSGTKDLSRCKVMLDTSKKNVVFETTNALQPEEQMSASVLTDKSVFILPGLYEKILDWLWDNWVLLPIWFLGIFLFIRFLLFGKEHPRGSIMPQWNPPENLHPIEVGVLHDEKVEKRDLTATLMYFATKKWMTITKSENEKNYTFAKIADPHDLCAAEKILWDELFSDRVSVSTDQLKYKFYNKIPTIYTAEYKDILSKGYYYANPDVVSSNYNAVGWCIIFIGGFISVIAENASAVLWSIIIGVAWIVIAQFMPKKTKTGIKIYADVLGLKEYISRAERYTIDFFNAPEKNPKEFERLLPYAIAFGVEKKWMRAFKDVFAGNDVQITGTNFSTHTFMNDMNAFSSNTVSAMTIAPASSGSSTSSSFSSSGGSSFGGGGFSGGGFGGGGGSSW